MKYITLKKKIISDFSQERNALLKQAKSSWVFFIDSDEELTPRLKHELKRAMRNKKFNYAVKRRDWFLGKKLRFGETSHVRLTRLIQPGTGKWVGRVHERFISWLPIKNLNNPLKHQRSLNISQFVDRLNYYSSLRAEESSNFSLLELLFYPLLKFVKNYLLYLGFLDGIPGLGMAFLMSLHSLFVRIKQYEKMA